jgi:hypothetical protein
VQASLAPAAAAGREQPGLAGKMSGPGAGKRWRVIGRRPSRWPEDLLAWSCSELGKKATLKELELALRRAFAAGLTAAAVRSPPDEVRRASQDACNAHANISNLIADRVRVNKLELQVPAWVDSAVARLTEVPGHLGVPSSFAVCAAMLAFGDELLVLPDDEYVDEQQGDEEDDQQGDEEEDEQQDDEYEWRTPGGRELAAAYLLPLAEAALRPRCSGWPTRLVSCPGPALGVSSRAEDS